MASQESAAIDPIRSVVKRLARPHRSGGSVIERAAILAGGRESTAIFAWITDHPGEPEAAIASAPARGLYGSGFGGGVTAPRGPARYLLPPGALATPRGTDETPPTNRAPNRRGITALRRATSRPRLRTVDAARQTTTDPNHGHRRLRTERCRRPVGPTWQPYAARA
jgi:hypothetical protein